MEPDEHELLVTAIKNFTKEQKAQHASGYYSSDEFFKDACDAPKTPLKVRSSNAQMRGT